ncbi:MAG: 4Fe-4S binding protein [Desulfobulbaceae bacterium]|nr:4Fe-4S binding protein [Desulfobulbaceae bacterium]
MNNITTYIGPRRRLAQLTASLLLLLLPWLEVGGKSLLRLDIPGQNLYLFGQLLRIQELYLVLLVTLIFVLGFVLITVVLGRVWCGWLCPHTTLTDAAEWLARSLGLKVQHNRLHGALWRKILLQLLFLALAFLVAANLLWYFIPPPIFFARLLALDLHYATWITLLVTGLLVYLDLALVRRLMCREICPYGRVQTALVDKATLSLHLPESELARCIECQACVRSCPMEIDIRRGYQVECTNCGSCLDGCRRVMSKRGEPGLIRYTFGLHGEGIKGLLNPRVLLPAVAIAGLLLMLTIALINRPTATLKVAVSHTAATRQLAEGQSGTFFNAWLNNRSQQAGVYSITARRKESGAALALKGQVRAELPPGENRQLDFVLLTPGNESLNIEFILSDEAGHELAVARASVGKTNQR